MTIQPMEHVGIVFDELAAAIERRPDVWAHEGRAHGPALRLDRGVA